MTFSKAELERYSRQILLYGLDGQKRFKSARIVVIGAGGLGSSLLPLLAAAGIGTIEIFDGDRVEQSNLGRQMIYRESDIGKAKAEIAAVFLRGLNPHIEVISHARHFGREDEKILTGASAVCEGSDSLKTKFLLNDLALAAGIPAFIAALGKDQGHAMLVHGRAAACYRCVFDELAGGDLPSCASEGILSTFPAVVSAAVAHSAIMHLLTPISPGSFWVFEKNHCRTIQIKKRQECDRHQNEEETDLP